MGSVTNLGSAALQNPIGSVKFGVAAGSAALVAPVTAANRGSYDLSEMWESKECADSDLELAEQKRDFSGTVQAFSHPQQLSDSQTTADKAVFGLAVVGLIIAALSATGLAPQLMAGLNLPALPMR